MYQIATAAVNTISCQNCLERNMWQYNSNGTRCSTHQIAAPSYAVACLSLELYTYYDIPILPTIDLFWCTNTNSQSRATCIWPIDVIFRGHSNNMNKSVLPSSLLYSTMLSAMFFLNVISQGLPVESHELPWLKLDRNIQQMLLKFERCAQAWVSQIRSGCWTLPWAPFRLQSHPCCRQIRCCRVGCLLCWKPAQQWNPFNWLYPSVLTAYANLTLA